jgi:hypothetical protein
LPTPGSETPGFFHGDGVTSEKSMLVDGSVTIKLCVAEGSLKINGWRRNEVRVFVKNGRKFHLKALEKSAESGKPNWLWIGTESTTGQPGTISGCLAGDAIEIDAPAGTSLDLRGREVSTTIDTLKKAAIDVVAGSLVLRNIHGGISAQTGRGDIIVESSTGAITLAGIGESNIVVADVKAGQIGDLLRAKTSSGAISMQRVEHRQIQANSISGSILFDGKFLSGGIYNFRTSNGSIDLVIPANSSCTFTASYGVGRFHYELPLKVITHNNSPRAQTIVAKIGTGEAAVSLSTSTGAIGIRKTLGPL